MRLGILGGTFNPIHFGHLRAAEDAREKGNLDKVIFIPAGNPPIKISDLSDASHRYEMTRIAISSNKNFEISDIEIQQKEKSYAINTIKILRKIYPNDELFFILGIDAFLDLPNWWQPERIVEEIDFIIVSRPGYELSEIFKSPYVKKDTKTLSDFLILNSGRKVFPIQITQMGISSTEIRNIIKKGMSIKYLLPESVEHYIYKNNLFK